MEVHMTGLDFLLRFLWRSKSVSYVLLMWTLFTISKSIKSLWIFIFRNQWNPSQPTPLFTTFYNYRMLKFLNTKYVNVKVRSWEVLRFYSLVWNPVSTRTSFPMFLIYLMWTEKLTDYLLCVEWVSVQCNRFCPVHRCEPRSLHLFLL